MYQHAQVWQTGSLSKTKWPMKMQSQAACTCVAGTASWLIRQPVVCPYTTCSLYLIGGGKRDHSSNYELCSVQRKNNGSINAERFYQWLRCNSHLKRGILKKKKRQMPTNTTWDLQRMKVDFWGWDYVGFHLCSLNLWVIHTLLDSRLLLMFVTLVTVICCSFLTVDVNGRAAHRQQTSTC